MYSYKNILYTTLYTTIDKKYTLWCNFLEKNILNWSHTCVYVYIYL